MENGRNMKVVGVLAGVGVLGLGYLLLNGGDDAKAAEPGKTPGTPPTPGKTPATPPPIPGKLIVPPDTVPPFMQADGQCATSKCGPARRGFASNPNFQWYRVVGNPDNASLMAKRVTGNERRYPEIVTYAKQAFAPGKSTLLPSGIVRLDYTFIRDMRTKGDPANPFSSGYNWVSLVPGDRIPIPKTWNIFIDEQGYDNAGTVWPDDGGLTPSFSP